MNTDHNNLPTPTQPSPVAVKPEPAGSVSVSVRWPTSVWISFFGLLGMLVKLLVGP